MQLYFKLWEQVKQKRLPKCCDKPLGAKCMYCLVYDKNKKASEAVVFVLDVGLFHNHHIIPSVLTFIYIECSAASNITSSILLQYYIIKVQYIQNINNKEKKTVRYYYRQRQIKTTDKHKIKE